MEVLRNRMRQVDLALPAGLRLLMTRNPISALLSETGCLPTDFAGRVTELEVRPLASEAEVRLLCTWLESRGSGFGREWSLRDLDIPAPGGWLEDLCRVAAACRPSCHPKHREDLSWRIVESGIVTLRSIVVEAAGGSASRSWDERLLERVDQMIVGPVSRTIGRMEERRHFACILKDTRFSGLAARLEWD